MESSGSLPLKNTSTAKAPDSQGIGAELPSIFHPIGHISLNPVSKLLDIPDRQAEIGSFYISRLIHGQGLGKATIIELERIAGLEPISAKFLTLWAIANDMPNKEPLYEMLGLPAPFPTESWYKKRGFTVDKYVDEPEHRVTKDVTYPCRWVYMSKPTGVDSTA